MISDIGYDTVSINYHNIGYEWGRRGEGYMIFRRAYVETSSVKKQHAWIWIPGHMTA
jgi:hypothetical protein